MEEKNNVYEEEANTSTETEEKGGSGFDDMLKNKEYQSEFDKRIEKALKTARGKWQEETDSKINNAVSEALKTAKMSAEQKAQYEREKLNEQMTERETQITKRELQMNAKEALIEKGLPVGLYKALCYTDEKSFGESLEAVEKAFGEAITEAVAQKLKESSNVPKTGGSDKQTGVEAAFYALNPKLSK